MAKNLICLNIKFTKFVLICCLILSACLMPTGNKALAASSPKTHVWKSNINASVDSDGSINVSEVKYVDITQFIEKAKKYNPNDKSNNIVKNNNENVSFNPLIWNFDSFSQDADIEIESLRIAICDNADSPVGSWQTYNTETYMSKWNQQSPGRNCVSYDSEKKNVNLYSEFFNTDILDNSNPYNTILNLTSINDVNLWTFNKAIINFNYTIKNAPIIYKDVCDIRWDYISDTWSMDSYDTHLILNVSPNSSHVTSDSNQNNIYAWGHGSNNSTINLDSKGKVEINNSRVAEGTNAQLRVVFPTSWINLPSNINSSHINQVKLSSILREESVWKDWREINLVNLTFEIFFVLLFISLLIIVIVIFFRQKKSALNSNLSVKDINQLHPCIKNRLKNWNREFEHDLICAIMHLNSINLISIHSIENDFKIELTDTSLIEKLENNININDISKIDIRTLKLLFIYYGKNKTSIKLSDIIKFADENPRDFLIHYLTWQSMLTDDVDNNCKGNINQKTTRKRLFILSFSVLVITVVVSIFKFDIIILVTGVLTSLLICLLTNLIRNNIYKETNSINIEFSHFDETTDKLKDRLFKVLPTLVKNSYDKNYSLTGVK